MGALEAPFGCPGGRFVCPGGRFRCPGRPFGCPGGVQPLPPFWVFSAFCVFSAPSALLGVFGLHRLFWSSMSRRLKRWPRMRTRRKRASLESWRPRRRAARSRGWPGTCHSACRWSLTATAGRRGTSKGTCAGCQDVGVFALQVWTLIDCMITGLGRLVAQKAVIESSTSGLLTRNQTFAHW